MKLTQELVQELFDLDEAIGVLRWRNTRSTAQAGSIAGHLPNSSNRWKVPIAGKATHRSRIIFLYVYGWLPKTVDHQDRNPSNDRPDNLRPATRSQQNCNKPGWSKLGLPKGTGFTGNRKNPYRAFIQVGGRIKHLGCFPCVEQAAAAYREAAQKYFGEFACF